MSTTKERERLLSRLGRLERRIVQLQCDLGQAPLGGLPEVELQDLISNCISTRDIYLSMLQLQQAVDACLAPPQSRAERAADIYLGVMRGQ